MKKITPTHNNIVVQVLVPEKIGDIHLPEESRKQGQRGTLKGTVMKVGPEVKILSAGSFVIFHKHHFTGFEAQKFKEDDEHYLVMKEGDILAIIG